jgi:DNA-3-methyladenine glycosylase
LEPLAGVDVMLERSDKTVAGYDLTRGPGNVAKALGLHTTHTGTSLVSDEIYLAEDGFSYDEAMVAVTTRIGVDYAAEDALLPHRFIVKGNKYVSGKKNQNS